jgi:endonuclease/exonuclease/phosphatase family metal-dependent hydrolase
VKDPRSIFRKVLIGTGLLLLVILILGYLFLEQGAGIPAPSQANDIVLRTPAITTSSEGIASTEISVLTFNIAGLPWPIACGKRSRQTDANGERIPIACNRGQAIADIGTMFKSLRQQGREPDIVFLQEAFIAASEEIVQRGGYANWVTGPGREDVGPEYSERASKGFLDARSFKQAEKFGKRLSAGLVIASNFPIIESFNKPFNQWECAGFDCLANKGVAMARIAIPGVPVALEVVTTHYNSKSASGVSLDRTLEAHQLQVATTGDFLEQTANFDLPAIWGGDLNMRHSDERLTNFIERAGDDLNEVSSYCVENPDRCDIEIDWQSDTPWFDSQDLQGWASGKEVKVEPIRVEQAFHHPVNGEMPSDHNGFLVTYRLSWATPN